MRLRRPLEPLSETPPETVERVSMMQAWTATTFLHWRIDPNDVRALIPPHLEVDVFDGSAWVGLVPFRMSMRLPYQPALPFLSRYPEINVRTYVHDDAGRRGLRFLSLDVPRSIAVVAARTALGLPYAWSRMSLTERDGTMEYRARRLAPNTGACSEVTVASSASSTADAALARFLTARFRMFAEGPLGPYVLHVEHEPWPLRHAVGVRVDDELVGLTGLTAGAVPDHVVVSEGVHVRVGLPVHLEV